MSIPQVVTWSQVMHYLNLRLQQELSKLEAAPLDGIQVLQGRVQVLRELQNLPNAIAVVTKEPR